MTTTVLLDGQLALDLDALPVEEPEAEPLPLTVPTERIRPYVEAWLADGRLLRDLADASGIAPETLRKIKTGKRAVTKFRVADAIITAIDPLLWHTAPEAGGVGDLYASPLVIDRMGTSGVLARAVESRPSRKAAPAAVERPEARPREVPLDRTNRTPPSGRRVHEGFDLAAGEGPQPR